MNLTFENIIWKFQSARMHRVKDRYGSCDLAVELPEELGLYCFIDDTFKASYIGKADDIRQRLKGKHEAIIPAFARGLLSVRFSLVPAHLLDTFEQVLIYALKPPLNKSKRPKLVTTETIDLTLDFYSAIDFELGCWPWVDTDIKENDSETTVRRKLRKLGLDPLMKLQLFDKNPQTFKFP